VLPQLALGLVGPPAVGTKKRPKVGVAEFVLLHDGGGETAIVASVAAEQLQVLSVLPPQGGGNTFAKWQTPRGIPDIRACLGRNGINGVSVD